jgi:type II secretory pathway component GspD/PulD (secretin)
MKIHVLLLAGCFAFATVASGQNEPAPAAPTPAVPETPAPVAQDTPAKPAEPAAPTNAPVVAPGDAPAPATPTNAPAAAEQTPAVPLVSPASAIPTNAAADLVRTNAAGAELVPLIVIDDVPLLDAVKNLARQAGLNYLPDPKLSTITNQPNVTMRLENVSAQDALTAVLDTYGLQIIHDPRIKVSRITVKDPKAADPLFSRIIQLKYTQPSNVVDIVKRTLSQNGQVMGDPRTSQLIVVATEKEFPAVEELIAKLDTPTKQVLIEAQLWETAKNPRSVKGIDWAGTFSAQNVSYGNGRLNQAGSEVVTTVPGTTTTRPTPSGGSTPFTPNSTTTERYSYNPGSGITLDTARGFHPATAFLNADGLNAVISLFNTENDTEVVATPRAVTMDNQPATLSVTRAFPIFKITPGSANSPAGSEITYTNLGTILYVTPHIAANSNVSLRVIPEVSDVAAVDEQIVNGFRNTANIYAIRRMETHVMVPSGHTLVLGGLISDRVGNTQKKVPFLGDAPFLGRLFHHEDKRRDKANLIVFITPTIVGDYDFQPTTTEFLQTRMQSRPESHDTYIDSAKPYDWTKPKDKAPTETKALPAPLPTDSTAAPAK